MATAIMPIPTLDIEHAADVRIGQIILTKDEYDQPIAGEVYATEKIIDDVRIFVMFKRVGYAGFQYRMSSFAGTAPVTLIQN